MPMPFDATLKDIARSHPLDFEAQFDLTGPLPVALLNVDLSTITAATDVAFGHGEPLQSITDFHFQASRDGDLPARVLLYNAVFFYRYRVPVHSVVVLLRPSANDPSLDEGVHYAVWSERGRTDLTFEIVRMWQRPVERILAGGVGTLPLAPLCQMPEGTTVEEALPGILRQIQERLARETTPEETARLMAATFVLTGLRLSREVVKQVFQGVQGMRESSTYQLILDEGRVEARQQMLLEIGTELLGPPSETEKTILSGLTDPDRLKRISSRLLKAGNWQELLSTP
jgi:predicted transposase YdaD